MNDRFSPPPYGRPSLGADRPVRPGRRPRAVVAPILPQDEGVSASEVELAFRRMQAWGSSLPECSLYEVAGVLP